MGFKEQVQEDICAVFLNLDEFAETHRVEGKDITVVLSSDGMTKLKQGQILGLVEADILLFARTEDLPKSLDPGRILNLDGREMLVVTSGTAMGMSEVALKQNRNG